MSSSTVNAGIGAHQIVDQETWFRRSEALLVKEKEFTRSREAMSGVRRELPWTEVTKEYTFDGPDGPRTLKDLFDGRSQLIVYHFMYGPGWDEGCGGCSFVCDHVDAARQHFEHHDLSFAAISRAPWQEFEGYKKRMGWKFAWLSSNANDFNYDFGASFRKADLEKGPVYFNFKRQPLKSDEQPGLTVFIKDENGKIFRTYSSYERGLDILLGAYNFIDLTPIGRNESGPMEWVRRHDQYEE